MKQLFYILILILFNQITFAHDGNYYNIVLKDWHLQKENKVIKASFYLCKGNTVYLEDANHQFIITSIQNLSTNEQNFIVQKKAEIEYLNTKINSTQNSTADVFASVFNIKNILLVGILFLIGIIGFQKQQRENLYYLTPIFLFGIFILTTSERFELFKKTRSSTNPLFVDSAFTPFKPNVHTFYDANYFYVESKGIPTSHPMMVGISSTGWQQQVPIFQCYIDTNAWQIPLNPVMASSPIPVDNIHFTRGAIAIAANGVPIFNPYTNTGVDAFLDGQLNNYGGHCGRADDYHYHIAPLHLYAHTSSYLPIAFALDGFPVYGTTEPDGTTLQTLDANHGHAITGIVNGLYHYHGSATAPYMIGRFAGMVTEDATHQLIPQPKAKPVRTSLTPLNGALITSCIANTNNNGYTLIYTLNGQTDSIVYSWNASGVFDFKYYVNGNGISNDSTYIGKPLCYVPNFLNQISKQSNINIYPNPCHDKLFIKLAPELNNSKVLLFSSDGKIVKESFTNYSEVFELNISYLNAGNYFLMLIPKNGKVISTKFLKHD